MSEQVFMWVAENGDAPWGLLAWGAIFMPRFGWVVAVLGAVGLAVQLVALFV